MNDAAVKAAEREAKRFLILIAEWRKDVAASGGHSVVGTKASGAVRRSSMDLTRALAVVRKP